MGPKNEILEPPSPIGGNVRSVNTGSSQVLRYGKIKLKGKLGMK